MDQFELGVSVCVVPSRRFLPCDFLKDQRLVEYENSLVGATASANLVDPRSRSEFAALETPTHLNERRVRLHIALQKDVAAFPDMRMS